MEDFLCDHLRGLRVTAVVLMLFYVLVRHELRLRFERRGIPGFAVASK